MKTLNIYWLAIKYWFQGDNWTDTKIYATRLVNGFR